ncbi:MAG: hypothetical protein AAGN66_26155 [Acidobacteriota bacterium]
MEKRVLWVMAVLALVALPAEAGTGPTLFTGASTVLTQIVDFFSGPVARAAGFVGLVVGLAVLLLGDGRGGSMKVGLALVAMGLLGTLGTITSTLLGAAGATF